MNSSALYQVVTIMFQCFFFWSHKCLKVTKNLFRTRLPGDRRRVSLSGDRRPSLDAPQRGSSHEHHEHQTGPSTENLCPHQYAQGLVAFPTALSNLEWTSNTSALVSSSHCGFGYWGLLLLKTTNLCIVLVTVKRFHP